MFSDSNVGMDAFSFKSKVVEIQESSILSPFIKNTKRLKYAKEHNVHRNENLHIYISIYACILHCFLLFGSIKGIIWKKRNFSYKITN